MKKFFKVVVARWLARTPIGLAILGLGWILGRRRKERAQSEGERGGRRRDRIQSQGKQAGRRK
ncbi:DUF6203 family protein [Streptosporangium subroseum]|uniref:DUF6203 family protein n=1 Tax=Streptosporangium subroseum TaxID=106412 RepID=UPI0030906A34|nr:DUF6203 family protein [Streptosporangium subroseum]